MIKSGNICNVAAGKELQYSLDYFSVISRGHYTDVTDGGGHNILVGREGGFDVLDTSKVSESSSSVGGSGHEIVKSVTIEGGGTAWSIQKYNNCIYTLCKVNSQLQVVVFDANTYVELKRWSVPEIVPEIVPYLTKLAVCDEKVYITDPPYRQRCTTYPNDKQLCVFSTDGKHLTNITHSSFIEPSALSVCPPHGIIIRDPQANRVHKLDTRKDDIIWSSTAVKIPGAVCCDNTRGEVWVWSHDTDSMFILDSETGMQLIVLYCKFNVTTYDIYSLLYMLFQCK